MIYEHFTKKKYGRVTYKDELYHQKRIRGCNFKYFLLQLLEEDNMSCETILLHKSQKYVINNNITDNT